MTRYLFYFHYWQLPDEPIEAVIDFDPSDRATKVVEEINEEISYHTGVDPEENTFMFVELFGLRPFNPKAWTMKLEEFVGYYGNTFVAIDLSKPDLGETDFFRPKKISGGQRTKFVSIGIENDDWSLRAQFEVRLISSLITWFQFFRKTKWLSIIPLDGQKNDHRIWQVKTEIPESSYSALWVIILPYAYPQEPPKLFISKKDLYIASEANLTHIWKDSNGSEFYFISDVNVDSTRWEETDFLVDFLLTGIWNFLVRSLHVTFEDLLFYKVNVANAYIIKEAPPQQSFKPLKGILSEIADSDAYEDDIDYKVEIAEIQEEIDYNEEASTQKKTSSKHVQTDDIDESEEDDEFEDDSPKSKKRGKLNRKNSDNEKSDEDYQEEDEKFDNSFDDEESFFFEEKEEDDEDNDDLTSNTTPKESPETKYQEWVTTSDEAEINKYGKLYSWLLLRVPDKALKDLYLLQTVAPDHKVFDAIEWRFVVNDLTEQQLAPFAENIINYYYENTVNGLIYDTDREFLRETVFKLWKNKGKEPELKELLRKNVSKIKKVTYESIDI